MNRIVLFGTGNLGKRYIQAISKLENVELVLNDISYAALDSVSEFLRQNNIDNLNYRAISEAKNSINEINEETIVVVSTTSNDRIKILKHVIAQSPKAIICEKPVTQIEKDYLELLNLTEKYKTPSFVDFTLRMQPFYQQIKNQIKEVSSGVFIANLPLMGLACVGIHQIDMFMWLFNLNNCDMLNSSYKKTYEQKRKGFFDVVGSIELESGNFKAFINNSEYENFRTAQVITEDNVFDIHEDQKVMYKVNRNTPADIKGTAISYSYVSSYMTDIFRNLINQDYNKIVLPNFKQSYYQHKILFDYLKKHNIKDLNFT